MIVIDNLMQVANQIETERGIDKEVLFTAVEQALESAYRKRFSEEVNVVCELNRDTGEAALYHIKNVVTKVVNDELEINKKEATVVSPGAKVGDEVKIEVKVHNFGRIAAQAAKQVIVQRLREAEKESVYDEFQEKIGQIITGTVQQVDARYYLVNLGRTEAILPTKDQIPGERFQVKEKIKVYVVDIEKGHRGNHIYISRTHPGLIKCLFEQEIPEIQDGIIEIKSIARDAGKRSKIAVATNNPSIGAVGTCVGQMGGRIQAIIKEIGTEKIDVLEWDELPRKFIANALKPAKVSQVIIDNEEEKTATVVVPEDQLSLAIGKEGVNVRLSVKLTNWKLDILSESEYEKKSGNDISSLSLIEKLQIEKEKQAQLEAKAAQLEEGESPIIDLSKTEEDAVASEPETIQASDLAEMLNLSTKELVDQVAKHGITINSDTEELTNDQVEIIKEKMAN